MERSPKRNIAQCVHPAKEVKEVRVAVMDKPKCVRPVVVRDVPEAKAKCAHQVAGKEPQASRCLLIPQPISDLSFLAGSSDLQSLLPVGPFRQMISKNIP